jgi:hypothetical protein
MSNIFFTYFGNLFDFIGNLGGLVALGALIIPKVTDLCASRMLEKYKTALLKDVESFKRRLEVEDRNRNRIEKIMSSINLCVLSLSTARDIDKRLLISRTCYSEIIEYEELLRGKGFCKLLEKLDYTIEDDHRIHHEGEEWLSDLVNNLYDFHRKLSELRET